MQSYIRDPMTPLAAGSFRDAIRLLQPVLTWHSGNIWTVRCGTSWFTLSCYGSTKIRVSGEQVAGDLARLLKGAMPLDSRNDVELCGADGLRVKYLYGKDMVKLYHGTRHITNIPARVAREVVDWLAGIQRLEHTPYTAGADAIVTLKGGHNTLSLTIARPEEHRKTTAHFGQEGAEALQELLLRTAADGTASARELKLGTTCIQLTAGNTLYHLKVRGINARLPLQELVMLATDISRWCGRKR